MKNWKLAALAMAVALSSAPAFARGGGGHGGGHSGFRSSRGLGRTGEHYTHAYTTKNGTYVAGHYATNPNGTRNDNYSTRGNINPHTGAEGTKPRDEDLPR